MLFSVLPAALYVSLRIAQNGHFFRWEGVEKVDDLGWGHEFENGNWILKNEKSELDDKLDDSPNIQLLTTWPLTWLLTCNFARRRDHGLEPALCDTANDALSSSHNIECLFLILSLEKVVSKRHSTFTFHHCMDAKYIVICQRKRDTTMELVRCDTETHLLPSLHDMECLFLT